MKNKILITNKWIHPFLLDRLRQLGFICETDFSSSREELGAKIKNYCGLVMKSRFTVNKAFLKKAVKLRFLARVGVGFEHIDVEYAQKKGIKLFLSPEGSRDAVGEHTLGLLLNLLNKISKADREIRQGAWFREPNRGIELKGKTVGIIGFGNMGRSFAKKISGLEAKVIAYDKYEKGFGNKYVREVSLKKIFSKTDFLSIHIPYDADNHYFIDKNFLQQFRKPIYIINTARGLVLNTEDLVKAIKKGVVLGAALDVIEYEEQSFESFSKGQLPKAFRYLIQSDRVVLTPHVAGWTEASKLKHARVIAEKIERLYFNLQNAGKG